MFIIGEYLTLMVKQHSGSINTAGPVVPLNESATSNQYKVDLVDALKTQLFSEGSSLL